MKSILIRLGLLALLIAALAGCGSGGSDGAQGVSGPAGTPGVAGADGEDGADGTDGTNGAPGTPGAPGVAGGLGILVTDVHGAARAKESTRGTNNADNPVTTINSASINTDGKLVVNFKVATQGGTPMTALPASGVTFLLARLTPENPTTGYPSHWLSYRNLAKAKANGVGSQPDGAASTRNQAQNFEKGNATGASWTNNPDGSYTYVSGAAVTAGFTIASAPGLGNTPAMNGTYAYDPSLTHRVAIELADPDGTGPATAAANNATFDFVPNGSPLVSREVVNVDNCNSGCHRTLGMHHSGSRLDTKLCVMCHNPSHYDPESGNVLDLKVMVHKIHNGKYLPSADLDFAGEFNGQYNADPEAAIKGTHYRIWGNGGRLHDYSEALIPSNPANCVMCHKNAAQADNYKTKPSREACGACHDGINFADGSGKRMWFPDSKITMGVGTDGLNPVERTDVAGFAAQIAAGHKGGARADDKNCVDCHKADDTARGPDAVNSIPFVHGDFTNGWSKVKTDYTIDLTLSAPGNGTHYVVGEAPIVTIVIKDAVTGAAIDHTAIGDDAASPFGPGPTLSNAATADANPLYGLRKASGVAKGVSVNGALNLAVSGPRALRKPALTTMALRPFFFSVPDITDPVTLPSAGGNGFNDLRTRVLVPTLPKAPTAPAQDDFGKVNGVADASKTTGVISRTDAARIQYQLAPISASTAPGTYVAMLLATKKSVAGTVPKAMSIAKTTFNVGQATEEKRVAFGCPDCHSTTLWHDNAVNGVPGNHPAPFDPDYCGSCHDYQANVSASTGGGTTLQVSYDSLTGDEVLTPVTLPAGSGQLWKTGGSGVLGANNMGFGASPIVRRVHGVHAGGIKRTNGQPLLNYPLEIYNGHNVSIKFPQDVRNCEKCHNSATSGTWATKPSRLACLSCHDKDATRIHAMTMTVDATPTVLSSQVNTVPATTGPFSGDESEACPVCHTP